MYRSTAEQTATPALIKSRLGYSNSILNGTSASNLHKLQIIHNAFARTVTHSRSVSTYQLLSNLYWLPIHKRIHFKVAPLTYKILSSQQPAYLHNSTSYHQSSHLLCSSNQSLLHVPRTTRSSAAAEKQRVSCPHGWRGGGLALQPTPPLPPLVVPVHMVESESQNVRTSSVPSVKRTLR